MHTEIINQLNTDTGDIVKIIISSAKGGAALPSKVTFRPVTVKGKKIFQREEFYKDRNLQFNEDFEKTLECIDKLLNSFSQVNIFYTACEVMFKITKKGKVLKSKRNTAQSAPAESAHNRKKSYIINEGDKIDALVDLGIFDRDYKIIKASYDKYRQINRFVEIISHAFSDYKGGSIKAADFGCGKAYLTFLLYHYFSVIKGLDTHITGYDLKTDVVDKCNTLSAKYGYGGLEFKVADVKDAGEDLSGTDLLISLHACDTATDYAIKTAVENNVKYIFSVPCCQHEVSGAIKNGGDFDLFFKEGIIKQRFCALLTDAVRVYVLKSFGYKTDVLEFVESGHSDKNLMLRAVKTSAPDKKLFFDAKGLIEKYGSSHTLISGLEYLF